MFSRTISLIGFDNYQKIKDAHILVIGVGGVGGYAVESLIRSGIEKITIVDYDKIALSNINRQLIATLDNIGMNKVNEFQKRITSINHNVQIKTITEKINQDNIDILFDANYDFIIDACDTIIVKKLLLKKCHELGIKLITVCGMGKRLDPSLVKICNIEDTSYDPIAKVLRKYVKDEKIKGPIPCIFSSEKPLPSDKKTIASMVFVPAVAGLLAAYYVIKRIIEDC